MSLSISGSTEDVDELMSCIINYDQLCKAEATEDTINRVKSSWCCEGSTAEFELTTKYYDAKLLIRPHEGKVLDGVYGSQSLFDALKCTEGFIDIVPFEKPFDAKSRQKLADIVTGLPEITIRLLVSIKRLNDSEPSEDERMNRMLWALDSGFEHIEIDDSKLLEGWKNREKDGLPRLMESLNSNMWSTMKRRTEGSDSIIKKTPDNDEIDNPTNKDANQTIDSKAIEKAVLDLNDGGEVSDELDDQLFGHFADVMSKAKEYRDQAVAGSVTDDERRNRAEAMALALSNMLGVCDDDSD